MASLSLKTILLLAYAFLLANVNGLFIPHQGQINTVSDSPIIKRGSLKLGFDIRRGSGNGALSETNQNEARLVISHKRGEATMELQNEKTYYTTDLAIGSNKQVVTVSVDTGSSDLWVVGKGAQCTKKDCTATGVFDDSSSTSYKNMGEDFFIKYADKTSSNGTWATDEVSFGDAKITGLQFGDVTTTSLAHGVLGIARTTQENYKQAYDNLPILLKKQGIINKTAYSLYLSSTDASKGNVLFGAIDKAKYSGELTTLPMPDSYLSVNLQSVSYYGEDVTVNTSVVMDSGTTLTYLPQAVVQLLVEKLGGTASGSHYKIPCTANTNQTLDFQFEGVTIKVPYSDLLLRTYYTDGTLSNICYLGVMETIDNKFNILGDNFLRNAYLYYDLDDKTIALAQAVYTDKEDIQVV